MIKDLKIKELEDGGAIISFDCDTALYQRFAEVGFMKIVMDQVEEDLGCPDYKDSSGKGWDDMTKFTIGSQRKTRGGWRAVVVELLDNNQILVWHGGGYRDQIHDSHGLNLKGDDDTYNSPEKDFDLIEPWVEPVKHKGFLNIYPNDVLHSTEEVARIYADQHLAEPIACIEIEFTEGEGL